MKSFVLVLAVASCMLQVACDKGQQAAPSSVPAGTTLKVVDAGQGPKKRLRFTPQKGAKKTMQMTMDMGMSINVGGSPMTQTFPSVTVPMEMVIADIAKNGDIRYDVKMLAPEIADSTSLPDEARDMFKTALASMTGLAGTVVVTDRGFTKQAELKAPAGAKPEVMQFVDSFKQSMTQISAPLPDEEVGVGAKWDTTTKLEQNGISVLQVATNELVALDGNVLTLKLAITQSASPQKITKDGVNVELETYQGTGHGESKLDLVEVLPTNATVALKSTMKMKAGGQVMDMGLDVTMTMASR